ncbi:hypothetical protein ACWDSD_10115 [Streptomyces spiralis]|uniref:Uncharacterized protein n=1 Tax=Streptomyces spiralis TaxID=66376 RepID=A0A919DUA5_9ACTN|nr:hypothetical protein [Streptomyces spiralis]GHE79828.1 hypothetical protein GCM10014715_38930 [Streptomyces spiralis]
MAYGAHHSPIPPHPDLSLARDCDHCLGWGTVITRDGQHELCDTCQPDPGGGDPPFGVPAHRPFPG